MKREFLLIIDSIPMFGRFVNSYCDGHFKFKKTILSKRFSQVKDLDFAKTIIFVNSDVLLDPEEIIMMSKLIRNYNTPVIIYSNLDENDFGHALDAIELGAIDIVDLKMFYKARLSQKELSIFDGFVNMLATSDYKFDVNLFKLCLSPFPLDYKQNVKSSNESMVIIGSDFGAMSSIMALIPKMPAEFPYPICLVMNSPVKIIDALVDRLNINSSYPVISVKRKTKVKPSSVYVMASNKDPVLDMVYGDKSVFIRVHNSFPYNICLNSSINRFISTAVDIYGNKIIGVLMAGIQEDGIDGLKNIKENKGKTILQSDSLSFASKRLDIATKHKYAQEATYIGDMAEKILSVVS